MALVDGSEMRRAFESLLWPGVQLAIWGDDVRELDVFPEERQSAARAVPSRVEEFLRGRSCLRACLDRLAAPRLPVLPAASREPQLPPGFIGSITHGAGGVAAIAAPRSCATGIGLDIEEAGRMTADMVELVLSPRERETVRTPAVNDAVLAFSAKESVHKALFPTSRRWFDFLDVAVDLTRRGQRAGFGEWGEFAALPASHLPGEDVALLGRLRGRYLASPHFVFTTCRFD